MQLIKSFHLHYALFSNMSENEKNVLTSLVLDHPRIPPKFQTETDRVERLTGLMADANVLFTNQVFVQPLATLVVDKKSEPVATKPKLGQDDGDTFIKVIPALDTVLSTRRQNGRIDEIGYNEDFDPDQLVIASFQLKTLDGWGGRHQLGWRLDRAAQDVMHSLINYFHLRCLSHDHDICDIIVVTTYREIHLLSEVVRNNENVIEHLIANHRVK